jgi:putative transposase
MIRIEGNLSGGMMQLNGVYAQKFNRKYKRVGHLFQGRYKAVLVEKEAYLLELSRYIILNPVKARLVEEVEEWPWSSYPAIIGKNQKPDFLTTDWILEQFGRNTKESINAYKTFIISGKGVDFPLDEIVGQLILGSEKFLRDINRKIGEKNIYEIKEYPRGQRLSSEPKLDDIFQKEMRAGKSRDEIIYSIYYDRDYTQKEIAEYLDIHYTTISRIIKRFEQRGKC